MYKVYKNLHNGLWSLQNVYSGLVVGHCEGVSLSHVTFKVSEAGRQRVIREQRKNVHAFIVGRIISVSGFKPYKGREVVCTGHTKIVPIRFESVNYNPYKAGYFTLRDGSEAPNPYIALLCKMVTVAYNDN